MQDIARRNPLTVTTAIESFENELNSDSNNHRGLGDCRGVETTTAGDDTEAAPTQEEDDDITIISLERPRHMTAHHLFLRTPAAAATDGRNGTRQAATWILASRDTTNIAHAGPTSVEDEEHQLNRVLRDLERIQSYNCCHFMIWCLVPTVLLIFVLVCVYQDSKNNPSCTSSPGLTCTVTDRSYYQMFLARCKCDSVTIAELYVER